MTEPNANPPAAPPVRDRRTTPPGVLPKNMQGLVLGGIAALMVAVIAFSGRPPAKPASTAPQVSAVIDPNAARIQEYQRRIEEQTRKLQLEQAQLAQSDPALALGRSSASPGRGAFASGYSSANQAESSLQTAAEEREHRSLFASNIALSYRKDASAPQASPLSPTAADVFARILAESARPLPGAPPTLAQGAPPAGTLGNAPNSAPLRAGTPASGEPPNGKERTGTRATNDSDASLSAADGKRYRLFEGTFFETVLTNRLDGSFSGPVNCMVTTNVYSHDGQHLLIPQGAKVLGEARKVESFGQERLAVFFHRLIMPDGFSVNLDTFQGLNQVGETGLKDQINHHYLQVFGVSLAIGAIAGLGQINSRSGLEASTADLYQQGVASSLSQSSLRILDRYLNVLPTMTIREGHRVKVYLAGDLMLPAYDAHRVPNDL